MIDKNTELLDNRDRAELRSTKLVWPPLLRKLDRDRSELQELRFSGFGVG